MSRLLRLEYLAYNSNLQELFYLTCNQETEMDNRTSTGIALYQKLQLFRTTLAQESVPEVKIRRYHDSSLNIKYLEAVYRIETRKLRSYESER